MKYDNNMYAHYAEHWNIEAVRRTFHNNKLNLYEKRTNVDTHHQKYQNQYFGQQTYWISIVYDYTLSFTTTLLNKIHMYTFRILNKDL